MNRIYRSIWNAKTGTFVAASEIAQSHGGKASAVTGTVAGRTGGALEGLAMLLMLAFGSNAFALPTDGIVSAGQADIAAGIGSLTINQSSQNAVINWQSFNIGAGEAVRFNQPNAGAIALNRVLGADPSTILGSLSANGQIFLVNPNGILFGHGAQVNVGGLVASTLNITDSDFMAGHFKFAGSSRDSIVNQGTITASEGGYVALLGANVNNQGVIAAKLGTVALAAGEAVTLDVAGDGLLNVTVDQGAVNALADNGGLIQADGGQVLMTAQAAGQLLNTVVNNTGVIQAQTIDNHNGTIKLLGDMDSGTVNVGGTLDASAPAVRPEPVQEQTVRPESVEGQAGFDKLSPNGERANAQNTVRPELVEGPALSSADAHISTQTANGGFIETSAAKVQIADSANITTKAANGQTGMWLVDPVDFTIAASGGDITGAALGTLLGSNSVTLQTTTGTNDATNVYGASGTNGDIFVNDAVTWSANTLTLNAFRNILINANLNGSLTAGLALEYGQGAAASGNTASYSLGNGAKVNLATTGTFSTKLGSDGTLINYTIVTSLGAEGDATAAPTTMTLQGINAGDAWTNYVLGADIDASGTATWNSGAGFTPLLDSGYSGTFDGLGHSIGHLTVKLPSGDYVGLFGYLSGWARVTNLALTAVDIQGANMVGAVAGFIDGSVALRGTVSNVSADGSVAGSTMMIGGLVGLNRGIVRNSQSSVTVVNPAADYVGGLVGLQESGGSVDGSHATGDVAGRSAVGGLVGTMTGSSSTISNSFASGKVTGDMWSQYTGGLVGENRGTVTGSFASGESAGGYYVGGLAGANYGGAISNSFAIGKVSGSNYQGGLVGANGNGGTIDKSYAAGLVTSYGSAGGLVPVNSLWGNAGGAVTDSFWDKGTSGQASSAEGTGKTSDEMKQMATFANWSIANASGSSATWRIYEGQSMPLLRAFLAPLTVTATSGSKTYDATTAGLGVTYSATTNSNLLGSATTSALSSKNVGSYTVSASGLYSNQQGYDISYAGGTVTVTKADLAVTGLSASNKTYDAGTTATLTGTAAVTALGSDSVTLGGTAGGSFADKNVGTAKAVTVTGNTLSGTDAGNYNLVQQTGLSADITKANLAVTGLSASNKTYDAGTTATLTGTCRHHCFEWRQRHARRHGGWGFRRQERRHGQSRHHQRPDPERHRRGQLQRRAAERLDGGHH